MSWLEDVEAVGKTVAHMDGTIGTVLSIRGAFARVCWEDDVTSEEHEDFLMMSEGR